MGTTPAVRSLLPATGQAAGRSRSTKKPVQERTGSPDCTAFLKHSFQPFYSVGCTHWQEAEREFFTSLSHFCTFYGLEVPDVTAQSFPQNVAAAYQQVKKQAERKDLRCIIGSDREHTACIASVKTFNTGYTLYYLPLRPVWKIAQTAAQQPLAGLLICLCRYCYHAGVSFYRDRSYMGGVYDMLQMWITDDLYQDDTDDDGYRQHQLDTLEEIKEAGDKMLPFLSAPFVLSQLKKSIAEYKATGTSDETLIAIATEFWQLAGDYPKRSIEEQLLKVNERDDDCITLDHYLSFYWSMKDCLNDTLEETINVQLQECCTTQEPVSYQWFDREQKEETQDFDFETMFFDLTDRLAAILNDYDHEGHHPTVQQPL